MSAQSVCFCSLKYFVSIFQSYFKATKRSPFSGLCRRAAANLCDYTLASQSYFGILARKDMQSDSGDFTGNSQL